MSKSELTNMNLKQFIRYVTEIQLVKINGTDINVQGGSNMTGTDLCVNKPHCAAAVRP